MESQKIDQCLDINKDPYHYVMQTVFCKWKPFILQAMAKVGVTNFSRFAKQLPISQKVLSQNLKVLERDGLVFRDVIPETPPRTEYRLTQRGQAVIPLLGSAVCVGQNGNAERRSAH